MRKLALPAFAVVAFVVLVVTLGPVHDRPQYGHPDLERFAPFLLMGGLLAAAYPKRPFLVGVAVAGFALVSEAAQGLVPHRDPRVVDGLVKFTGAWCGVGFALCLEKAKRIGEDIYKTGG